MRSHLLVLAALGLALGGCSKDPKEAKVWKCQQLGVPGGETLSCTQQAATTDGVSVTTDGYVPPMPTSLEGEGCEGSLDTEACAGDGIATGGAGSETGGASLGSDSTSATGTGSGAGGGTYYCSAGTVGCPPVSAVVGINPDSTSSEGAIGGGAGSSTGPGTGTSLGSDGTSSTGESTGGGGGGGDKEGDKDDAKPEEGGGAGSGPGGSSATVDGTSSTGAKGGGAESGESYRCETKKNGRVDCTRTAPTCEEGLSATGGICGGGTSSSGTTSGTSGTTSSTSSTGGDGSTTTASSTPKTTTSNGKTIGLKEVTTHPDGTKTWTYEVCEVSGHDLSNWVLGTGGCQVVSANPNQGFEKVSPDPNSGITGVKWNTGSITGCQTYSVTTVGGTQSLVSTSAKASTAVAYGVVAGPKCN